MAIGPITIYHNPQCSKSRQTLAILQESGVEPRIILYLEDPPTADELEELATCLGLEPSDFIRKKEAAYRELTPAADTRSRRALLEIMAEIPILIERPIVVRGQTAVLGRPPENVRQLIE
ncbi:MAG: arsenate reductase (glutaredoxin) [Planctomycetaceae bacterium]